MITSHSNLRTENQKNTVRDKRTGRDPDKRMDTDKNSDMRFFETSDMDGEREKGKTYFPPLLRKVT